MPPYRENQELTSPWYVPEVLVVWRQTDETPVCIILFIRLNRNICTSLPRSLAAVVTHYTHAPVPRQFDVRT